ncbi:hypothetical protein SK85_02501 [Escherichia coli]|nr:hypothetical protein SK85_02501 [Escherichia coli]
MLESSKVPALTRAIDILNLIARIGPCSAATIIDTLGIPKSTAYLLLNELRRLNRPGFPGECFICELRLPDHRFRWKHNKLFLLLPEEYGPAFPAIVDCYTSPPT